MESSHAFDSLFQISCKDLYDFLLAVLISDNQAFSSPLISFATAMMMPLGSQRGIYFEASTCFTDLPPQNTFPLNFCLLKIAETQNIDSHFLHGGRLDLIASWIQRKCGVGFTRSKDAPACAVLGTLIFLPCGLTCISSHRFQCTGLFFIELAGLMR